MCSNVDIQLSMAATAGIRTLSKSIKDSVTLITGGRSSLGQATVKHFLKNGSRVVVYDLPESFGQNTYDTDTCINVSGDVTSEEETARMMKKCKEHFGRLDNVITCAGLNYAQNTYFFKRELMHSYDNFLAMLSVNVSGRFNVVKQAAALMKENKPNEDGERGVIVNTSSISAYDGMSGQVAISACDGAIASMTLPLSRDLAEIGIRVVTVAPGMMDGPVTDHLKLNPRRMFQTMIEFPRRFGEPLEFAELCKSVCENPMINGEVIRLDSGTRYSY